MSLEKTLLFRFPDVTVQFKPELIQSGGGYLPLCSVKVKLVFPSGVQKEGDLCYDLDKRVFITALTDLWEYSVDWNDPNCDMEMVKHCDTYRLELSRVIDALLQLDVAKTKTYEK